MRLTIAVLFLPFISFSQSLETIIQKGHELAVVAVAVSADSNYVATASKDKSAKLWEMSTGREVRSFLGHEATVTSVEFSNDGKFLMTGSNDKSIRLWDVSTGREVFSLTTAEYITDIAIDPKMKYFVVAGYDRTDSATVYDFASRKVLAKIPTSADQGSGSGVDIAISPDGRWVAFGEDNRVANVYQSSDWKNVHTFPYEEGSCGGCGTRTVFSPDSKILYKISDNGPLRKYDLATYKLIKTYEEKVENVTGIALSADGKVLARATEKEVQVWDEASGRVVATLPAEDGEFHEITFSRDGKKLLVPCDNNTTLIWDFVKNKKEEPLTGFLNQRDRGGLNYDPNFYWESNIARYVRFKNSVLISRDGKTLIKGKFGTKVKRWDIATGKTVMEYVGHKKAVLCYDLSRDGRRLLTGGGDGKIMLWDVETGKLLQTFITHTNDVMDVAYSHDGKWVATASADKTIDLWKLNE